MSDVDVNSSKNVLEPLAWILQLTTGIILVFLVSVHFYVTHMTSHEALSYDSVVARLSASAYSVMYAFLLLSVSFHAFNGLRAIVLDTEFGARNRKLVNSAAFIAFLLAFAYGLYLLVAI